MRAPHTERNILIKVTELTLHAKCAFSIDLN